MIVLTGGAGFIGSGLLRKLNNEGLKDILVVDHLGNGEKWKNLVGKKFYSFEHKEEFRKRLNERRIKEKIELIIHFGACSTTTERDADYLIDNNVNYSKEIAEFAVEKDIRMIYASSAATYGSGESGYSDAIYDDLKPLNGYGFSKHIFDLWILEKGYDKLFAGIKFFNVFGPNEYHKGEMASMVYKSFKRVQKNGKIRLFRSNDTQYPDGGQMRDFIYSKDCNKLLWDIINNRNVSGIFNMGTGNPRTWNDLANAVFAAIGKEPVIDFVDMPEELSGQYQNYTNAEMEKLSKSLSKINFSSLEESVEDYIKSHLLKAWKYY